MQSARLESALTSQGCQAKLIHKLAFIFNSSTNVIVPQISKTFRKCSKSKFIYVRKLEQQFGKKMPLKSIAVFFFLFRMLQNDSEVFLPLWPQNAEVNLMYILIQPWCVLIQHNDTNPGAPNIRNVPSTLATNKNISNCHEKFTFINTCLILG